MKEVALFIPCLVDQLLPEIGTSVVKIFRKLGVSFVYDPRQTCCGQPLVNAGDRKGASQVAKHFISIFEGSEYIVAPSGSCIYTVKEHYPRLLADEPVWYQRACGVSEKAYEFSQFLVAILGVSDVDTRYEARACLHESCAILRQLGVSDEPKTLLKNVEGLELTPLNDADVCCGFGGEFAVDYPDISEAILKDKANNFKASGADILILGEPGCLLNIRGYMSSNGVNGHVKHIAEILASE
ncbi:MAG: (Fe-S)-binding protein [Deltaproteobacteria bacterium]|nr:(Fe-S)-binding protein [Deltaproteobacteria bacterium]